MREDKSARYLHQVGWLTVAIFAYYLLAGFGSVAHQGALMGARHRSLPAHDRSVLFESPSEPVKIHFIDVGQGASILVQAGGEAMLIDAGSAWMGRHVVHFCDRQGVQNLDIAVATSPSQQRLGGLTHVFEKMSVQLYCDPGPWALASPFNEVARAATGQGVSHRSLKRGDKLTLGDQVLIQVLWPPEERTFPPDEGSELVGSDMLVLSMIIGRIRVLLLSDLPIETERKLLRGGAQLESTILHLADHGARSSNSTAILDEVAPQIAIASVGVYNERDVPHVETLQRLVEREIGILRTDRHGTITVGTDGRKWWVVPERRYEIMPDLDFISD